MSASLAWEEEDGPSACWGGAQLVSLQEYPKNDSADLCPVCGSRHCLEQLCWTVPGWDGMKVWAPKTGLRHCQDMSRLCSAWLLWYNHLCHCGLSSRASPLVPTSSQSVCLSSGPYISLKLKKNPKLVLVLQEAVLEEGLPQHPLLERVWGAVRGL